MYGSLIHSVATARCCGVHFVHQKKKNFNYNPQGSFDGAQPWCWKKTDLLGKRIVFRVPTTKSNFFLQPLLLPRLQRVIYISKFGGEQAQATQEMARNTSAELAMMLKFLHEICEGKNFSARPVICKLEFFWSPSFEWRKYFTSIRMAMAIDKFSFK